MLGVIADGQVWIDFYVIKMLGGKWYFCHSNSDSCFIHIGEIKYLH